MEHIIAARNNFIAALKNRITADALKSYDTGRHQAWHLRSLVDDNGDLWYGSCENVTRRWIRELGTTVEAQMVEIRPEDQLSIIAADQSNRSWTFINTAGIATVANYPRMIMAAAEYDDCDVRRALKVITSELQIVGEINLEAPITFEEYFMYLHNNRKVDEQSDSDEDDGEELCATASAGNVGTIMYDEQTQSGFKITKVSCGFSPMVGRYLAIQGEQVFVYSAGAVARVTARRFYIDEGKPMMITALPIRPATADELSKLDENGRAAVAAYGHRQYCGMAYTPGFFGGIDEHTVSSRVVFDPAGLRQINANQFNSMLSMFKLELNEPDRSMVSNSGDSNVASAPTEDDYKMVCQFAPFYNLHANRWMMGRIVGDSTPVNFRSDAFDRLVLSDDRKRLLKAITNNLYRGNTDVIDGKGGGAIFLLDGAPGTGKTLTAEATAECLQRVLYKVSLGELGTDVSRLEQVLNRVLTVAARWDAILLIDEADVFLEKRTAENIHRNALVAVFLRLLEYYEGVLFLTTNRGDNIDAAMMSRVTLGLHYTAPTNEGMKQIWTNLLTNAEIKFTAGDLDLLVNFNVNGREIKNSINSARALAADDRVDPTVAHVIEILRVQRSFFDDLKRNSGTARSY